MAAVWKTAKRVFRDHKRIPGDENMPTNDELLLLGLSLDTFKSGWTCRSLGERSERQRGHAKETDCFDLSALSSSLLAIKSIIAAQYSLIMFIAQPFEILTLHSYKCVAKASTKV